MDEQSRRFACDRCRGHKLRCERAHPHGGDTGPCKRCLRAHAECVTSPAVRMGRPSHSDKKGTSSPKHTRRPSIPNSTASFRSNGVSHDNVTRQLDRTGVGTSDWSGSTGEFVNVGQDATAALDFQAAIDGQQQQQQQQQSLLQHWQSTSTFPKLSHNTFTVESNGNNAVSVYPEGGGAQVVTPPGLNVLDFDQLFATDNSIASGMHNSMNPSVTHTVVNSSREPASLNGTLPSEDSVDLAMDSYLLVDNIKEDCLQRLSNLSANLLQDLNRIRERHPIGSTTTSPINLASGPARPSTPPRHAFNVGRMLEHSEMFLEILQHVGGSPSTEYVAAPSPATSNVRYFDLVNDDPGMGFGTTSTTTLSQLLGDGITSSYVESPSPSGSISTPNPPKSPKGVIRPDVPTMLAVLTCYTSLIRIYNSVFTYIHASLLASPSARQKLLPPLPGLHLCGFKLEQHQNLQLEILARVSLHMLSRLEKVLDELGSSCVASGVLEESMAANLLNMIIKQSFDVGQNSDEGSLKDITKSIRELLEVKLVSL